MNSRKKTDQQSGGAPYEGAIIEGMKKLDSQIFIFLVLYALILSGMLTNLGSAPLTIQLSIALLPIFGICGFIFFRQKSASRRIAGNIQIAVKRIGDKAEIIGQEARGNSGNVRLNVGDASGEARVVGVSSPTMASSENTELQKILLQEFEKLNSQEKIRLISDLQK